MGSGTHESEMKSPLKEIREAYGITQAQLASVAGISSGSYVCEIEAGLHPISEKIIAILRKAHVNVEDVIKRHDAYMDYTKSRLEELLTVATEAGEEAGEA